MKVFISADIEGIAAATYWTEVEPEKYGMEKYENAMVLEYDKYCEIMTDEVLKVCEAAFKAGATEIVIKDAHHDGTNINTARLPKGVKIIRGWERHPYEMVQGIDESFDCVAFVGYHSAAGNAGNSLSHTMSLDPCSVKINGVETSEFLLYSIVAASLGVPTVFLAGDKALCDSAKALFPWIETAAVKEGKGHSTKTLTPHDADKLIYKNALKAFSQDMKKVPLYQIPEKFECEVTYKDHADATARQYYPGCRMVGRNTVGFTAKTAYEMAQTFMFIL